MVFDDAIGNGESQSCAAGSILGGEKGSKILSRFRSDPIPVSAITILHQVSSSFRGMGDALMVISPILDRLARIDEQVPKYLRRRCDRL
jgi:hypothetical protein